jgi:hypothetical protein
MKQRRLERISTEVHLEGVHENRGLCLDLKRNLKVWRKGDTWRSSPRRNFLWREATQICLRRKIERRERAHLKFDGETGGKTSKLPASLMILHATYRCPYASKVLASMNFPCLDAASVDPSRATTRIVSGRPRWISKNHSRTYIAV